MLHQCLLILGQRVIRSAGHTDGRAAVTVDREQALDHLVHLRGSSQISLILSFGFQTCKLCFCVGQNIVVFNQRLLIGCQRVIRSAGGFDSCFAVQCDFADFVDLFHHIVSCFLVNQILIRGFCGSQSIQLRHISLLRGSQVVVSGTGRFDGLFAVQRDVADFVNQAINRSGGSFVNAFLLSGCVLKLFQLRFCIKKRVIVDRFSALDNILCVLVQCIVASARFLNLLCAFQRDFINRTDCGNVSNDLIRRSLIESVNLFNQRHELIVLVDGQTVFFLLRQRFINLLRRFDLLHIFQRCAVDGGQSGDLYGQIGGFLEAGNASLCIEQLLIVGDVLLAGFTQRLIGSSGDAQTVFHALVVVAFYFDAILVDQPHDVCGAVVNLCIDHFQNIPCTVRCLRVASLRVHGWPALHTAPNVDGVACDNGDGLRPLIEADTLGVVGHLLVEEGLYKEILVRGGRRDFDFGLFIVDLQGVLVCRADRAGRERREDRAVGHVKRPEGGVLVVPCAAEVLAVAGSGIHDADFIAVAQLAVGNREVTKALVGEPVVQRSHPAGLGAAIESGQAVDRRDVVAGRAGL